MIKATVDNITTFMYRLKSGDLNLLEPSGPVQACKGIALAFVLYCCISINCVNRDAVTSRKCTEHFDDYIRILGEINCNIKVFIVFPTTKTTSLVASIILLNVFSSML